MSRLPLILFGTIGGLLLIVALAFVFDIGRKSGSRTGATLTVAGTEDSEAVQNIITSFREKNPNINVAYERLEPATYEETLINRIATGKSPDIFFMKNTWITEHADKIYPLPQEHLRFTVSDFRSVFADSVADLITKENQIIGLPLGIETPVLLYNKDIFNNAGIAKEPRTWDDVRETSRTLTRITAAGDVEKSGIALGTYANTEHAFEIISSMIFQEGDPIIDPASGEPVLDKRAAAAVSSYASFADPRKQSYAWDKRFGNSLDAFAEEKTAMAFAFPRDISRIRMKNPHIALGILPFPQKSLDKRTLYAEYSFPVVSRVSQNPSYAWSFLAFAASKEQAKRFARAANLTPVRRDLLSEQPADPDEAVSYRQALIARTWPVPEERITRNLFRDMVESILSDRIPAAEAVARMKDELRLILHPQR